MSTARRRGVVSWQTMLADLSLILFMVTAAAMGQPAPRPAVARPLPRPAATPGRSGPPVQGEPLAVYRAVPGAPPLARWLAAEQLDPREQLTITTRYRPGERAQALARAADLAERAGAAGGSARIVIEPRAGGDGGGVEATLAFDRSPQ